MKQIYLTFDIERPLRLRALAVALACAGLLGACTVAPVYQVPATPVPASFKEAGALWQTAQPNDALERGEWWSLFGDAQLNQLAAQVQVNNQNIAAAAAAVAQAQAAVRLDQAGLLPSVNATLGQTRQGGAQASSHGSAFGLTGVAIRTTPGLRLRLRCCPRSGRTTPHAADPHPRPRGDASNARTWPCWWAGR